VLVVYPIPLGRPLVRRYVDGEIHGVRCVAPDRFAVTLVTEIEVREEELVVTPDPDELVVGLREHWRCFRDDDVAYLVRTPRHDFADALAMWRAWLTEDGRAAAELPTALSGRRLTEAELAAWIAGLIRHDGWEPEEDHAAMRAFAPRGSLAQAIVAVDQPDAVTIVAATDEEYILFGWWTTP
jgi:hypothetical protein